MDRLTLVCLALDSVALLGLGLYHYSIWAEIREAKRETSKFPR